MKKTLFVALMVIAGFANAETPTPSMANMLLQGTNSSGYACNKVTSVFFQGVNKHDGKTYVSYACSGGQTYMLAANKAEARIVDCGMLEKLGVKEACFTKF